MIHRQPRLLDDRFPKKLSNQLEAILKKANVELVLGDEHIQEPDLVSGKQNGTRTIRTKKGKELQGEFPLISELSRTNQSVHLKADFVFIAIGNTPNTQVLADADPSALAKDRTINVNEYLQVRPRMSWISIIRCLTSFCFQVESSLFPAKNVFAAGDCANSPGWRSLISTEADVATIAKNISALLSGAPLKKHAPGIRAMVVPTGPSAGAGFAAMGPLGDTALPQFMVPMAKGRDLFTSKFFDRFNTAT